MVTSPRRGIRRFAIAGWYLCAASGALAQRTPPPLDAYGDLPAVEAAAISASGRRIAAVTSRGDDRWLLIFDQNMAVLRNAQVSDVKTRGLDWAGDDTVLLTTSRTEDLPPNFVSDSFEAFGAITVPADPARKIARVFADTPSVVGWIFGRYGIRMIDGKPFAYYGSIPLARRMDRQYVLSGTGIGLFQVDLRKNTASQASPAPPDGFARDWLVDREGEVVARFDMNNANGSWSLLTNNGKELATGTNPAGEAGLVASGKDGTTAVYGVRDGPGRRWYEIPLDGSAPPAEILADRGIETLFIGKNSGRLIGYLENGTESKPVFFDPAWDERAKRVARAFSKFDYAIEDWDDGFENVLVRTSGTGDSGTWYLVDIADLRAEPIGYERPLITADDVGPVSIFDYQAQDGLELDGVLTLPPGRDPENLPVIMLPHGGPTSHDEAQFDWWAQAFASRGYAVFQPNFRGSTNRGPAFRRAGDGEWGRKMQSDISDGLTALARAGIVDPHRACIVGASYGGYAALAGVTLQHGLYRCAVSVAGLSDLKRMYISEHRESGRSNVLATALQEELGGVSDLGEVSPINFADTADAPILLIHGRDDTVVAFEQSTRMANALKSAGKPYEFVELKGEDHWLSKPETRKQMLAASMAFVLKYDPPR